MAIQFHCPSCRQPIEIDDEHGGQSVACPYCQKVVSAPARSEPVVATATAQPTPPGFVPSPPSVAPFPFPTMPPAPPLPNTYATLSLMCALLIVATFCVASVAMFRRMAPKIQAAQASPSDRTAMEKLQKDMMKEMETIPAVKYASFVSLIASVAGVALAILGFTRREGRRWQAIVGVTICGLMLLCNCGGFILSLAAGAKATTG